VQQLSLNPQKLAGQCGKLKCCLNYEYEMYKEAAKDFPDPEIPLFFRKGKAVWQKTDVFARTMYYAYANNQGELVGLSVESVHEIIKLNQDKDFPENIELFTKKGRVKTVPNENAEFFDNVVGQDDLTRFDKKKNRPQQGQKKRPPRDNNRNEFNKTKPKSQPNTTSEQRSEKPAQRPEKQAQRPVREIQRPILKPKTKPDA